MFSPAQERQRARMSRLMDRELPPRYRCSKPAVIFTICSQRAETTVARFLALPVCGAALNARVRPRQPTSARSRARRTRTARTARTRPRGGPGPNGTNTRREGRRRPRTRGPRSRWRPSRRRRRSPGRGSRPESIKVGGHVCVATTTAAHLRSNVRALALDLDEADLAWLARGP